MNSYLQRLVERKIRLAKEVVKSENGGYLDAMVLLLPVISGIASLKWPGKGIDKGRFVELLVRFNKQTFSRVSLPMLIQHLEHYVNLESSPCSGLEVPESMMDIGRLVKKYGLEIDTLQTSLESLKSRFRYPAFCDSRVFRGRDLDCDENLVTESFRELPSEFIRTFSYGGYFYWQIRNSFIHEMDNPPSAVDWIGRLGSKEDIEYANYLCDKDQPYDFRRRIYFPLGMIFTALRNIAAQIEYPIVPIKAERGKEKRKKRKTVQENRQPWWIMGDNTMVSSPPPPDPPATPPL